MVTSLLAPCLATGLWVPQEGVELPVSDQSLCTTFEETFRVADDLTTVSSVGFDNSGAVRIGDAAQGGVLRVIVATADGQFRRQVRMGDLSNALNMTYRATRAGGLLGQFRDTDAGGMQDSTTLAITRVTEEARREVVRIGLEGDTARVTPFAAGWQPPRRAFTVESTMGGVREGNLAVEGVISRVAFLPRLLWDVLPTGGIAMSDSSAYAIKILDANGRVVRVLRRQLSPRPINDGLRVDRGCA